MSGATPVRLAICVNRMGRPGKPCCGARGSLALADAMEAALRERALAVSVERIVCLNKCHEGPNMRIVGGRFFTGVDAAALPGILDELAALAGYRRETLAFDGGSMPGA
ncbi:MAG: (2Fe-2S) ferredoxin domain-containing protein [Alphaproteobacteria bacterium]